MDGFGRRLRAARTFAAERGWTFAVSGGEDSGYAHPADTGGVLTGERLVFGSAMVLSVVLGLTAIRRRDIARHRAWMIRGYAIGLGAGTQVFTQLPWILIAGPLDRPTKALLMGAGWLINIAVAERVIRRRSAGPSRLASAWEAGMPTDLDLLPRRSL